MRNVLVLAWIAAVFAGCATGRSEKQLAEVKVLEAESAIRLAGEGQLLYETDPTKRNGYDYCSLAVGLIEQGQFRLGIREASKALFLGQASGDRCLVAFAKRDLAVAYSFAGHLDRTYAWTVRRSGVTVTAVGLGRDGLRAEIHRFRQAIAVGPIDQPSEQRDIRTKGDPRMLVLERTAISRRLYEHLIRPLGLRSGEDLVVVPHDSLHYLPFQALIGDAGFLIEERGVSYLPTAATLRHFLAGREPTRRRALGLGNPDLGSPRLALPGAEREVEQLRTVFPEAEISIRASATKQQFMGRAPTSEVIHVAAHAALDDVDPLHSAIQLASSGGKPGDLEAHEVYELDLSRAALVTLSACKTGLGRVSRGDELWGFTRSFLAAGSRTLLVSLWAVEDETTSRLMGRFYQRLREDGARTALRRAQLEVLADPLTRDPFLWAAFNMIGDWR